MGCRRLPSNPPVTQGRGAAVSSGPREGNTEVSSTEEISLEILARAVRVGDLPLAEVQLEAALGNSLAAQLLIERGAQ